VRRRAGPLVVDPTADTDEYAAATEAGLTVTGVIDTHVHADHISGGRDLANDLEVPYYLSERASERDVEREYTPLERNEVLSVGEREVKRSPRRDHQRDDQPACGRHGATDR